MANDTSPQHTKEEESTPSASRRVFLKKAAHMSTMGLAAFALAACGGGSDGGEDAQASFSCTDVSGLTESERQTRQTQQYVDNSPNPEQVCNNCNFWIPPEEASTGGNPQCGGCQVVKGPIHPQGYCNLWAEAQGGAA